MTIPVTSISQVTEAERSQTEEILKAFIAEEDPTIDVTVGGVLYTKTLQPNGLLGAIQQKNFDRLRQSQSLLLVNQDPSLAEPDVVDGIMSNFLITRQAGAEASGQVIIILTAKATTVIAAGAKFTSGELVFNAAAAFTGVVDANLIQSSTDRLIQARPDGTYGFVIDVQASDVGEQYRMKKDTEFTMETPPANFVRAVAQSDFTGGYDEQTNQDLVNQIATGVSTKVLAGRANMEALIISNYPRVTHISIVGFGDSEMLRDRNNIFGISHGGKADIYMASDVQPELRVFTMTGARQGTTNQVRIDITRDVFPGFYGVMQVLKHGVQALSLSGLEVVSLIRGVDITGFAYVPDLWSGKSLSAEFGAFTRYQTATLIFIDDTPGTWTEAEYDISLLGLPNIDAIQDFINGRDLRNPNADLLVKAAVPMLAGVSLIVDKLSTELSNEDEIAALEAAIKDAVASRINALGFSLGKLPANVVVAAASSLLTGGATVRAAVELTASLVRPDGAVVPYFSNKEIVVPNEPELGVSQRTTLFSIKAADVLVTFNNADVVEV